MLRGQAAFPSLLFAIVEMVVLSDLNDALLNIYLARRNLEVYLRLVV